MTPVLSEAARAQLAVKGRSALWVFFTDKAIADERGFAAALRSASASLTERARLRRAREQGGRYAPDFDDVPVAARYLDAVRDAGAEIRHSSRWLNAVSVLATEAEARRIEALSFVRSILPIRASRRTEPLSQGPPQDGVPVRGETGDTGPYSPDGGELEAPMLFDRALGAATLQKPVNYGVSVQQLSSINVLAAHDSGWSGANEFVAMFDTGYNKSHTATVQVKRIAERDFIFNDGETANQAADVSTQWDHGTGTWAVAGGYWQGNLIGPAYNSTFLLAKTEDVRSETPVEEDNWVAAAEWADSIGADVISSSLSYLDFDGVLNDYTYSDLDGYTTAVVQGANFAQRRGIVIATAMANEGPLPGSLWSPADAESILSVGAVDAANAVTSFSSRGPTADGRIKPEVVAQGQGTFWAVASNNNQVASANGTSLSTPLIAGSAALVREAHPDWTVMQVRTALMNTADKAGTPNNDYGWGRIDVVKAIYSGPITFPKPFDQLVPINNTNVLSTPVTLRWRRALDPGDFVQYTVVLRSVSPSVVVFTKTLAETTTVVTSYLGPNKVYEWLVTAFDPLGHERPSREKFRFTTGATTDVAISPEAAPRVVLHQNRPNPAQRATEIPFTLAGGGDAIPVTLRIFDPHGRLVRTLVDGPEPTARHYVIRWDGRDQMGRVAGSGIYYYQLRAGAAVLTRRMVLLR